MTSMNNDQLPLFNPKRPKNHQRPPEQNQAPQTAPLAHLLRPNKWDDFVGGSEILSRYPQLKANPIPSLIIQGPPGTGKTTLARLLGGHKNYEFYTLSAVTSGVKELKELVRKIEDLRAYKQITPIIFIDEIHRFNRAQQDALLPHIEVGSFILIGATTENPRAYLNSALLSRTQLINTEPLTKEGIKSLLKRAERIKKRPIDGRIRDQIIQKCGGDARMALNSAELYFEALANQNQLSVEAFLQLLESSMAGRGFTKRRHYQLASALIKSMRGGAIDAATLYLAYMLEEGEDPTFIARRLVVFASEDIGNADPQALPLTMACLHAVKEIGLPEARINLSQTVAYLSLAGKSRASMNSIDQALKFARLNPGMPIPDYLDNFPSSPPPPPTKGTKRPFTVSPIPPFYDQELDECRPKD